MTITSVKQTIRGLHGRLPRQLKIVMPGTGNHDLPQASTGTVRPLLRGILESPVSWDTKLPLTNCRQRTVTLSKGTSKFP